MPNPKDGQEHGGSASVDEADSGIIEAGQRLAILIDYLGEDKSVEISGKSLRQLKRYCDGAEPPFGALRRLCEAASVTLDWLTYGRSKTLTDTRLNLLFHEQELSHLKRISLEGRTEEYRVALREQIDDIAELIEIETRQIELKRSLQSLDPFDIIRPTRRQTSVAAVRLDAALIEKLARIVTAVYQEVGHKVPVEKVTVEAATLYNELLDRVSDINDPDEIEATLPQLKHLLKKRLQQAAAEPGTGKRLA